MSFSCFGESVRAEAALLKFLQVFERERCRVDERRPEISHYVAD